MDGLWLASYIALWLFVVLQTLTILGLARQIGILHVRIGPTGARMMNPGPQIGDVAPIIMMDDALGKAVTLGTVRSKLTLIVFISLTCSTCKDILPGLKSLQRNEKNTLEIILVTSESTIEAAQDFVKEYDLSKTIPFVVSADLNITYKIGTVPYAVLVDRQGVVRSKGLVNNIAHVESLLNAEEKGFPTLESTLKLNG